MEPGRDQWRHLNWDEEAEERIPLLVQEMHPVGRGAHISGLLRLLLDWARVEMVQHRNWVRRMELGIAYGAKMKPRNIDLSDSALVLMPKWMVDQSEEAV